MAGMSGKAQHTRAYRQVPELLREMRQTAGLTQRALGERLRKPQSWVYNCESSNRRMDITEFIAWCEACEVAPTTGFARLLRRVR